MFYAPVTILVSCILYHLFFFFLKLIKRQFNFRLIRKTTVNLCWTTKQSNPGLVFQVKNSLIWVLTANSAMTTVALYSWYALSSAGLLWCSGRANSRFEKCNSSILNSVEMAWWISFLDHKGCQITILFSQIYSLSFLLNVWILIVLTDVEKSA